MRSQHATWCRGIDAGCRYAAPLLGSLVHGALGPIATGVGASIGSALLSTEVRRPGWILQKLRADGGRAVGATLDPGCARAVFAYTETVSGITGLVTTGQCGHVARVVGLFFYDNGNDSMC